MKYLTSAIVELEQEFIILVIVSYSTETVKYLTSAIVKLEQVFIILVVGIMQSVSYEKFQRWGYFGDVGHALPIVSQGTLQPFKYLNVNYLIIAFISM